MSAVKYLEEQLSKLDMFRPDPIQLTFEFWGGTWRCYYGWLEAYDGLYELDFLHRDGGVFEDVVEALVRDTEKYTAMIDEFLGNHRPYRFQSDDGAVEALITDSGIETHDITDVRKNRYGFRWRRDARECAGSQDVLKHFWVKTG